MAAKRINVWHAIVTQHREHRCEKWQFTVAEILEQSSFVLLLRLWHICVTLRARTSRRDELRHSRAFAAMRVKLFFYAAHLASG